MVQTLQLGEVTVDVIRKDIRNLHLSVYPPTGRARISAPRHLSDNAIRAFTLSKLDWIKKQRRKIREQERETPRLYIDRESHFVWGKRYLMRIVEADRAPSIMCTGNTLTLTVRPGTAARHRAAIMDAWYRELVRAELPSLIAKWEVSMKVKVDKFRVQRMKTLWGSCTPRRRSIRINTDLAKKPVECLEYIVVHEMTHLLEPSHNARFIDFMDRFMPSWRQHRKQLNQLPLRHEEWQY